MKRYSLSRLILVILFAVVLALSCIGFGTQMAYAATTPTLTNLISNNLFYKVGSSTVEAADVDGVKYPVATLSSSAQSVAYRKNLAYRWYEKNTSDASGETGEEKMFNLSFSLLGENGLLSYTGVLVLQSQQFEKTKDAVTTNYVVFVPQTTDNVTSGVICYVTQDEDDIGKTITELEEAYGTTKTLVKTAEIPYSATTNSVDINLAFTSYQNGTYELNLASDDADGSPLTVTNIGGTYAKYVSGTNAVTPIAFKANFGSAASGTAKIAIKSINNQSFSLNESEQITDDVAPVLCLNEGVNFLEYAAKISIDYTVIDVVSSSTDVTLSYYVYSSVDENTFTELSSSSVAKLIRQTNSYYFTEDDTVYGNAVKSGSTLNGNDVEALVKVKFTISDDSDSTSTDRVSTDVYLDWYVDEEWLVTPKPVADTAKTTKYLIASTDNQGATFDIDFDTTKVGEAKETVTYYNQAAQAAYQEKITALVKEQSLTAGSSNYLYLPSIADLVKDVNTNYEDLKVSIYYINGSGSKSQNTSLSTSNLSINVTTAGTYEFTFYVTDAEGNSMYYYNEDGNLEEFTSSDIWTFHDDSEKMDILPWFSFRVAYTAPSVEDPGTCTLGYVNSTYSSISFDISGVSGSYTTKYYLYRFERNQYTKDTDTTLSYEDFVEKVNTMKEDASLSKYFVRILTKDEVANYQSTDQEYIDNVDYEWDDSSLSFIPQDDNSFYVVKLELSFNNAKKSTCMAIAVSAEAESFYGETNWAKNNVISIVLLCVAGVALIAIVILLVIKPKDSGDIDVIDEKQRSKKNTKKGKAKKAVTLDEE